MMSTEATRVPATTAEIRAIVGDIDDETIVSIRDTGATAAEVLDPVSTEK